MKGEPNVINQLNTVLSVNLAAINQYFLHSRMYQNWGLHKLAEFDYHMSIKEMKAADKIIARILLLEGLPNLQHIAPLRIGENVGEMLQADLATATSSRQVIQSAILQCEILADYVSRDLLTELMEDEEAFIDALETQLGLIDRIGIENFQQSKL